MANKRRLQSFKKIFNTLLLYPERVYLLIGLIGVIGFALITPPFQGPDEKAHYIRAQYVAHGYVLTVDVSKSNAELPLSIKKVVDSSFLRDVNGGLKKHDLHVSASAVKTPLSADNTYKPAMIAYTAVPYLPSIPLIAISNTLNFSPLISMYLARLSLGIFCVVLTFFAIKIVPRKKYLFVAIALTPMLLFQQAMVSADGTSYALLLFFICYLLHLANYKQLTNKQWLMVGGLCLAITLAKPLVFLFLPLMLILIKKRHAFRWIAGFAIVCVLMFAGVSMYNARNSGGATDPNTPKGVDSTLQLSNIQNHPKRFLRVLWNSYMTDYGDEEVQGVIGIFGAADTKYPLIMTLGYVTLLVYAASVRFDKKDHIESVGRGIKRLLLGISLLYFLLINIVIYLSFSPVNFDIIYGVQGRYFLPILIILPVIVSPFLTIEDRLRSRFMLFFCSGLLVMILLALFITLQRYYLYTP